MGRFGRELKRLRKGRGLKQRELAAAVGASVQALRFWEYGDREPRAYTVLLLARTLGAPVEDLIQTMKPMTAKESTP